MNFLGTLLLIYQMVFCINRIEPNALRFFAKCAYLIIILQRFDSQLNQNEKILLQLIKVNGTANGRDGHMEQLLLKTLETIFYFLGSN